MLSSQDKARELAKVLKVIAVEPCTARQIAKKCGSTKPTAYSRLQALRDAGYVIDEVMVRDGKTGPEAKAYKLRVVQPQSPPVPANQVVGTARARARQRRVS
jgi:DNA-binding transcriptional ArsR family regulator